MKHEENFVKLATGFEGSCIVYSVRSAVEEGKCHKNKHHTRDSISCHDDGTLCVVLEMGLGA